MASKTADLIADVRKKLEQKYKDSTELFPDLTSAKEVEVVESPSAIINAITGIGGIPRGRVSEIHGPYSSGKTTIATEIAAELQRRDPGATILFVDYEHAFDATYGRVLGLDLHPDRWIFAQPEYFEQGAAIIDQFVSSDLVDLVVIDSAAAMTPKSELEGDFDTDGGSQKGRQAALMSIFLSIITKKIPRGRKPALLILNQTRALIQIGGRFKKNQPKEQPAGGNALKFYTSLRLELDPVAQEGDEKRGSKGTDQIYTQTRIRITAIKNKLAPPFMRGNIVIEYGVGINNTISIGELAEAHLGIMSGAGFFKFEGSKPTTSFSCRGREQFWDILKNNPEIRTEIEERVLAEIRRKHAEALGLEEIKTKGKAKAIQAEAGVMYLDVEREESDEGLPVKEE